LIFATVGSTQIPFERMVRALDALPGDELFAQHGPVPAPPAAAGARSFMQFPEIIEAMERADVVVCHAGAGSILCALRTGHTPVVVPRLRRYRETVDDHQVEFARALGEEGKVIAVSELDSLPDAVAAAPARRSAPPEAGRPDSIHAAVRQILR
jgi:UDP-N-acetylglucosamine transferase subunit ALG13